VLGNTRIPLSLFTIVIDKVRLIGPSCRVADNYGSSYRPTEGQKNRHWAPVTPKGLFHIDTITPLPS
jgi:hypothetical protein